VSVEEHGRTFNAYRKGKYLLPNDALEQERLDMAHEMWRLVMYGDLSWVPFEDEPESVLDIGTGTGIWAIEFAQQQPASHVIGTDISLIQPADDNIPSNCSFERDDVKDQWVFDRLFDYIHLRAMLTCFNDHVGVLQNIYENL
jgi:ubiquinone/menaquinone biosynthesis C-methylase UbiE